jgi:hypothetical protein
VLDIVTIMQQLAAERPVFHSEADFQHALAWHIHRRHPEYKVRLEYRPQELDRKAYVDIWIVGDVTYAIELKYKTRKLVTNVDGEAFALLNQSAQDIARYDFCKDVSRVESLAEAYPGLVGLSVFLTNDAGYWRRSRRNDTVDIAFRLHEGRELTGSMSWADHAADGTTKDRTNPIHLRGRYHLMWRDYSALEESDGSQFRMLVIDTRDGAEESPATRRG